LANEAAILHAAGAAIMAPKEGHKFFRGLLDKMTGKRNG